MVLPFYSARLESWRLLSLSTRLMLRSSSQQPEWLSINVSLRSTHSFFFLFLFLPRFQGRVLFHTVTMVTLLFIYFSFREKARCLPVQKRENNLHFVVISFRLNERRSTPLDAFLTPSCTLHLLSFCSAKRAKGLGAYMYNKKIDPCGAADPAENIIVKKLSSWIAYIRPYSCMSRTRTEVLFTYDSVRDQNDDELRVAG